MRLKKTLGASKVLIELAEALRKGGWTCDLAGPEEVRSGAPGTIDECGYAESLRLFLLRNAGQFDVVDYDHCSLPFPRDMFPPTTLFVARSVLLVHHFGKIVIPRAKSLRGFVGQLVKGAAEKRRWRLQIQMANTTMRNADLINVSCREDVAELEAAGFASQKIAPIPYGIGAERRRLFDAVSPLSPAEPMVGFVGTFDFRKGAREFPSIVSRILREFPRVRFRFMGTTAMFANAAQVRAHFPARVRSQLDVIEQFDPGQLPTLLAPCSIGIFPSYVEGFGFGVLEMLAASMPVFAYDSPGPTMMLPAEWLVPRGNARALSAKVIERLRAPELLQRERLAARERSQAFTWQGAARRTVDAYTRALEALRSK